MKNKATMWTVIGVVVFAIAIGLGLMFSGEKSEMKTIQVEQVTDSIAVDSNTIDTVAVDSAQ